MTKINLEDFSDFVSDEASVLPTQESFEARELAINYIKFSGTKSSGQVLRHLRSKNLADDLSREIIAALKQDGWIDDVAFAKRILEERRGNKAEGRMALKQRLIKRGVPASVAEEVLANYELSDKELAQDFLAHKCKRELRNMNAPDISREQYMKLYQKIARRCAGRGFAAQTVIDALQHFDIGHPYA